MKILIVHNRYQNKGGEDSVVEAEISLLRNFGQECFFYERSNNEIDGYPPWRKARILLQDMAWSARSHGEIRQLLRDKKPDIVHVHNTFLLVSPSVYDACSEQKIPVVQTLHNYRLLCANAVFYRDGQICEECQSGGRRFAVIHKCWKNSFLLSLAVVRMQKIHEQRGTFQDKIARYIALSEFSKSKFVAGGIPGYKISVKPNFLEEDPGARRESGQYVLFVGALREYKGIRTLLRAWERCREISLKIIGSGPLLSEVQKWTSRLSNVELLGQQNWTEVYPYIKGAACVVVPSECYENFPRILVESFACGVPVVASGHGVFPELIQDGKTGLLFRAGDSRDLAQKISRLLSDRNLQKEMGASARAEYEKKYTPEINYQQLMGVYHEALRS